MSTLLSGTVQIIRLFYSEIYFLTVAQHIRDSPVRVAKPTTTFDPPIPIQSNWSTYTPDHTRSIKKWLMLCNNNHNHSHSLQVLHACWHRNMKSPWEEWLNPPAILTSLKQKYFHHFVDSSKNTSNRFANTWPKTSCWCCWCPFGKLDSILLYTT